MSISVARAIASVETLEPRQLLSAQLQDGVLEVNGTGGNDNIVVSRKKNAYIVQIGDDRQSFKASRVRSITVDGRDGNDSIRTKGQIEARFKANGGEGNDTITGTRGHDTLKGGAGDDIIQAGSGNDRVFGDDGDDILFGDAGKDRLFGGAGNDILGGDDENVIGKAAVNSRNPGADLLDGGAGNDWLLSGMANTVISDPSGADTLIGGAGADIIDTRGNDDATPDADSEDYIPSQDVLRARENPGDVHTHANLQIRVRGKRGRFDTIFIPTLVGSFAGRFAALHTHTSTDQTEGADKPRGFARLHWEAPAGTSNYDLGYFFEIWGVSFDSRHVGRYFATDKRPIRMTVNGANNTQFENYQPANNDVIVITIG